MYKISKYNIIKELNDSILVYNSFTKASFVLDKDSNTKALSSIREFNKLDNDTKKFLIDNGFIIEKDRDELKELEYLFERTYFDTSFLNIVLVPSLNCNFKCPYCFEKGKSSCENVKEYFNILKKYGEQFFKNFKTIQFSLFGGEPLLYYKEVIDFLDWVKIDSDKYGYKYITSIVTNGSLLTREIVRKLLYHNLFSLQITLDSNKETHDTLRIYKNGNPSFDILINNSKMVVEETKDIAGFNFNLRINLLNCDTKKFEETLNRFEVKYRSKINLLIRAIYKTDKYSENNDNSVFELKKFFDIASNLGFKIVKNTYNYQSCEGCADTKFFYLMPDLTMWKCVNDLSYDKAKIGYIDKDGLPHVDPINNTFWFKNASNCFNDKKCKDCKLLPDCLGGCILHSCKNNKKNCKSFDMACLPYIIQ